MADRRYLACTTVDNTVDYVDQASFLGLRALGHGPVIQWLWIYSHELDMEALRRFHENLGRGLLGRLVEPSPLPFGRHRWVADPGPRRIEVASRTRPRADVPTWADEQAALPIDPEHGPGYRLSVQPLDEGGAAVALLASHTIVDGVGLVIAITEAAKGITRDLPYPPPRSRPKRQALQQDWRVFVRSLPEMARALVAAGRLARSKKDELSPGARKPAAAVTGRADRGVTVPAVTVHIDIAEWDARAAQLGGTNNSLYLGLGARLCYNLGWTLPDGSVKLSVPVNERQGDDDNRGNALTGVMMTADPHVVLTDLTAVRAGLKTALSGLSEARNELLAPVALTPLVPKALARQLEAVVFSEKVLGCSNVADMDPAANRPDGTDAEWFAARMSEHITAGHLARADGVFFPLVSGRIHGQVYITVGYADSEGTNTREELMATVRRTLDEMGLSGIVE